MDNGRSASDGTVAGSLSGPAGQCSIWRPGWRSARLSRLRLRLRMRVLLWSVHFMQRL
jgi:hypothetical protein